MGTKSKATADVNETANRADLNARAMRSRTTLHAELMGSEGQRIAAEQECARLRSEIEALKAAAAPGPTVVGIGALSRVLGYQGSLLLSLVHDGMPHRMVDGTAFFDLPTVHRWMLDRREARVIADCRVEFDTRVDTLKSERDELQALVQNQFDERPDVGDMHALADVLLEAIEFVTDAIDDTISNCAVPGKPETIMRDEGNVLRLVELVDFARRLRKAHADVPSPPATPGKPVFTNLVFGQPWTGSEGEQP